MDIDERIATDNIEDSEIEENTTYTAPIQTATVQPVQPQPQPTPVQPQPQPQPVPVQSQVVQPKPVKEKKAGKIIGKIALVIGTGLLFGVCAALAMMAMNKYYLNDEQEEDVVEEPFDEDKFKTSLEKDILDKVDSKYGNEESLVKTYITENDAMMQITDVSDVVENVMPSVVSIENNYIYSDIDFWGRTYEEEAEASGSGIIIGENDTELIIATNNHVIENAEELKVIFIDGSEATANIKGADADNDIAVIAVKWDELDEKTRDVITIASIGNSDDLRVGEPAIAIGNALGYGQSVTTGVISALDRKLEIAPDKFSEGFIQTDAAINPGNSGGALLNVKGEVVGINSNKIGGSAVEGMGYAIPVSRALPIIDDLKTKKTKSEVAGEDKGYLGISGQAVSDEMVQVYGFPQGVFVYEVYEGTGADLGGMRKGDIITKLEGTTVKTMQALQDNLIYYEAGEKVEVTVARANEDGAYDEITLMITLVSKDEMPSE